MVSADSHVVEPLEVFAGVANRLGRGEAKLVRTDDRGWVLDTGLGAIFQPGRFATAGTEPGAPEYDAQERSGYARDSLRDIGARLADLDRDGVAAELLFPSMVGTFLSGRRAGYEVTEALCRSYNDWLCDYCTEARSRLFPLACIPLGNLDMAIAEVKRAGRRGHVGIILPCAAPQDRQYADPAYDRLWATAQDLRLPVALHAGYGSAEVSREASFRRLDLHYSLAHVSAAVAIADLIESGVCTRFPHLRFVIAEFGTGWIAHFLAGMDWRQFRNERGRRPMRFSDVWRQSFLSTFEDDEIGISTRDAIGVGSLLWANDYPHGDSVWPESQSTVARVMADCTAEERGAMTMANVVALYRLPIRSSETCVDGPPVEAR